jgi:hypothetical protein
MSIQNTQGPIGPGQWKLGLSSPPPPTLELRHCLRPTAWDTVVALNGGCSCYSCITLATGLRGEGVCNVCLYLTRPPEDELWLKALWSLVVPVIVSSTVAESAVGCMMIIINIHNSSVLNCHIWVRRRAQGAANVAQALL